MIAIEYPNYDDNKLYEFNFDENFKKESLNIFNKSLAQIESEVGDKFYPRESYTNDTIPDYVQDFYNNGFVTSQMSEEIINKVIELTSQPISRVRGKRMKQGRRFGDCIEQFRDGSLTNVLNYFLHNSDLDKQIKWLLNCEDYYVFGGNIHVNDNTDDSVWEHGGKENKSDVKFHHFDTTFDSVKFMVYLSDVQPENGAFTYVKGSHRWEQSFEDFKIACANRRCGFWLRDDINRKRFMSLPSNLRKKNVVGADIDTSSKYYKSIKENNTVIPGSKGSVILFDPNGLHTGGLVEQGERLAIQVVVKIKK